MDSPGEAPENVNRAGRTHWHNASSRPEFEQLCQSRWSLMASSRRWGKPERLGGCILVQPICRLQCALLVAAQLLESSNRLPQCRNCESWCNATPATVGPIGLGLFALIK